MYNTFSWLNYFQKVHKGTKLEISIFVFKKQGNQQCSLEREYNNRDNSNFRETHMLFLRRRIVEKI